MSKRYIICLEGKNSDPSRIWKSGARLHSETKRLEMTPFVSMTGALRFHLVSGATEAKARFVSSPFPFVSCFPIYTRETGNETNCVRSPAT
jgi:hypothetical protein